MSTGRYHRQRYFVKAGLQLRYMAMLFAGMCTASVAVGWLLYVHIWGAVIPEFSEAKLAEKLSTAVRMREYEEARRGPQAEQTLGVFKEAKLLSAHEQSVVAGILRAANARVLPRLLIIMLAIGLASIVVSHKLAGPVYRFERSVNAMADGRLDLHFTLRRGDELCDLAEALERLAESLRERLGRSAVLVRRLSSGLESLSKRVPGGSSEAALMSALTADVQQLDHELGGFVLKTPQGI